MDMSTIWTGIKGVANSSLDTVMQVLPTSPFRAFIDELEKTSWLGYINWILPIDRFIVIGEAWLVAVGIFYLYSVLLRWVKAIE